MAAGGAAAVTAAIASAIKASGSIVSMKPEEFQKILHKSKNAVVVCATGGIISTNYQYLIHYKGLNFFTKAPAPLILPSDAEIISAEQIWIP